MRLRLLPPWALGLILCLPFPTLAQATEPAMDDNDPSRIEASIAGAKLAPEKAVTVTGLTLDSGLARLRLEQGTVIPVVRTNGRATAEFVFLGSARLTLEAPDAIEAGQLELFTGAEGLDEPITAAVLTVALDGAAAALAKRPPATLAAAELKTAEETFSRWQKSPEREALGVPHALIRDAYSDPLYESYFAGWFRGENLGDFLYVVAPDDREQVTLGRFERLDVTEKEKRKLEREIRRAQRRGKLIGLELDDLGDWDTWLSASLRGKDNQPRLGAAAFETVHYTLDVTLDPRNETLRGTLRLRLEAMAGNTRWLRLNLGHNVKLNKIEQSEPENGWRELIFYPADREALVLLPETYPAQTGVELVIEYEAKALSTLDSKTLVLVDSLGWYPRAGDRDLATYDVTLRWPDNFDVVFPGTRKAGGSAKGLKWEQRVVAIPNLGTSFEISRYKKLTAQAGHVAVTLYLDQFSRPVVNSTDDEILATVTGSLSYFEQIFGPYPLDELTVVTAPKVYSQSLLGFIALSSIQVGDLGFLAELFAFEDPRLVIAHEVSHQWWGHRVGWQGYRDQWISEAMANYSSLLYQRNHLKNAKSVGPGPTQGWIEELTDPLDDGRPLESVGPLVLGSRLASTKAPGAYYPIVYQKGAVVVDMMSRLFREQDFVQVLGAIVRGVDGRQISSRDFVALVEQASGTDLDAFAEQFIYSTGLPDVYYDYRFEKAAGGKWAVVGKATQVPPYRYRYRIAPRAGGLPEVVREAVQQSSVETSALVVPVQIGIFDPGQPRAKDDKGKGDERKPNSWVVGRTLLRGPVAEFRMELDHEPVRFALDRFEEVFGRFYDEKLYPKRLATFRGIDHAALGRVEDAARTFREALAAPAYAGPAPERAEQRRWLEREGELYDLRLHLLLARLALAAGDTAGAERELNLAAGAKNASKPRWLRDDYRVLAARIALAKGDAAEAGRLLARGLGQSKNAVESAEALAVRTIAAHATNDRKEFDKLKKAAEKAGVDLTGLSGGAPP